MKKIYLLCVCLCCMALTTYAQDINPSEQAKGYLESKNITVDYSTGTFHYSIPLFELKSGDFSLPININYTSNGIKKETSPGIIGYNWNLQYGGIVTRTIRGGIADEIYSIGSANLAGSSISETEKIRKINMHQRDGESDIFTAVFNGQSVRFLLKNTGIDKYIVEPIEQTDAQIKFQIINNELQEWMITDAYGIQYFYSEPEWTTNYTKQESGGNNNIINKSYISSWYLSKICIPNSDTIYFAYNPSFGGKDGGKGSKKYKINYINNTTLFYQYGRPLTEFVFDFEKYRENFEYHISEAIRNISHSQLVTQMMRSWNTLPLTTTSFIMPDDLTETDRLEERIIGILSDFSRVSMASSELVSVLDNLIQSTSSISAASNLRAARKCITDCLSEQKLVYQKMVTSNSRHHICPPLLTTITNKTHTILLKYKNGYYTGFHLDTIALYDNLARPIYSFGLQDSTEYLNTITWQDKKGNIFQKQKFSYYPSPATPTHWDHWGYVVGTPPVAGVCYAKSGVMSLITLPTGGTIQLDYENNSIRSTNYHDYQYGGIRIKSLIMNDKRPTSDTIHYLYPQAGVKMDVNNYSNVTLSYTGFQDIVTYTDEQTDEKFISTAGNNRLFYPYIEEVFSGKGKNSYLFFVPAYCQRNENKFTPFWLCGLPLGKAVYNTNGNLIRLQKNKYYADINFDNVQLVYDVPADLNNWFEPPMSVCQYSKYMEQVKTNGFYADKTTLEAEYRNQASIFLYPGMSISPYEMFRINILPRTNLILPDQEYKIYYGGKVLLKSTKEYAFPGNNFNTSSKDHLTGPLPQPYVLISDVEYGYDNPLHNLHPTRTIHYQSDGSQIIKANYTVADFATYSNSALHRMAALHQLLQPVKQQTVIKKAGSTNYELVEEKIFQYQITDKGIPLPTNTMKYDFTEGQQQITFQTGIQKVLFSTDQNSYINSKKISYEWAKNKYLPITTTDNRGDSIQIFFDPGRQNSVMQASGSHRNDIDILDLYRKRDHMDEESMFHYTLSREIYEDIDAFKQFVSINNNLNLNDYSLSFRTFYNSNSYQHILNFTRSICNTPSDSSWQTRTAQLKEEAMSIIQSKVINELNSIYPPQERMHFSGSIQNFLVNAQIFPRLFQLLQFKPDPEILGLELPSDLHIVPDPNVEKYVVYYMIYAEQDKSETPSCILERRSQNSTYPSVSIPLKKGWQLIHYTINPHLYNDVIGIKVQLPYNSPVAIAVIIPAGISFEAVSTDLAGNPFCKFDQSGQLERYEYDNAGRLLQVFDQVDNLLRENQYNLISQ